MEYNADADYHSNLKQREAEAKMPASKRKGAAAALRAQSTVATPMADVSEPQTPARSNGDVDASSRQSPTPAATLNDDDRAISPVSTASSASEPPLAQRVKLNGSHSKPTATTGAVTPLPAPSTPPPISKPPLATESPAPPSPSKAWVRNLLDLDDWHLILLMSATCMVDFCYAANARQIPQRQI